MAINYNLEKVYAISDNDTEFVLQIIGLFVADVPQDLKKIKNGIKEKDFQEAYSYAHKVKPTIDLLGMDSALEEVVLVEKWAEKQGKKKEIIEVLKSLENHIEKAVKEIKKDFNL
ncbi:Hpt domain-containing protein [Flavobacterium kingsejongi]|uniref:Histidine kinase n=1 Tax=Flavobacterium kingsejongi TaxID=1678728 RepID=A0A2S1LT86_9FLAO|nr:Hpt domain-containing protein [Flavobacterium kingsejongi]AWG26871.1 histidine kinase [Flavobacterium kingsejongi]